MILMTLWPYLGPRRGKLGLDSGISELSSNPNDPICGFLSNPTHSMALRPSRTFATQLNHPTAHPPRARPPLPTFVAQLDVEQAVDAVDGALPDAAHRVGAARGEEGDENTQVVEGDNGLRGQHGWVGDGMAPGWCWDGTRMELGWHWDGIGIGLGWHWDGTGMAPKWDRNNTGMALGWHHNGVGMAPG